MECFFSSAETIVLGPPSSTVCQAERLFGLTLMLLSVWPAVFLGSLAGDGRPLLLCDEAVDQASNCDNPLSGAYNIYETAFGLCLEAKTARNTKLRQGRVSGGLLRKMQG